MRLPELQTAFAKALKDGLVIGDTGIVSTAALSAEQRVAIYRSSILGSLQNTLSEIYPVCQKLVGDDFFFAMAEDYCRQTPSQSPDLGDYGETFPAFIQDFPPAKSLPYLSDTARLEWYWHRAFIGHNSTRIAWEALAEQLNQHSDSIVFVLHENGSLLASEFPIHRIWEMNQSCCQGDETIDRDEGGVKLFVWRREFEMRIDVLDERQWCFLKAAQAGMCFTDICEKLLTQDPNTNIADCLQDLLSDGLLSMEGKKWG